MCKCCGDCSLCKKPFKTKGKWCYELMFDIPRLIDGPQKFGEYYCKQFWTFEYTEGSKL